MFVQRRQFDLTLGDIVKIIEMVKSIALPRRKKGLQVSSIVSLLILTEDSHLIQGSSWPFLRAVGPKKKKKKSRVSSLSLPLSVASPNLCPSLLPSPL